jgi:DNA-binding NarL/FixJ family response regulator
MIHVIITEDNKIIREGLAILINATKDMTCDVQYNSCEEMLADIHNHPVDIILQDIGLPGMSGIDGVKELRKMLPEVVVLMLTVYEDEDNIFSALQAGASGYLLKKTPPAQLIEAIKDACLGGSPMSSNIARKVVRFFQKDKKSNFPDTTLLTERELEILTSLSDGNSYKMTADKLYISIDTVRTYIRSIYKKLHVHSQSGAVATAIKRGLIS